MSKDLKSEADVIADNERLTSELSASKNRVSELEAQLAQANAGRIAESNLLTEANQKLAGVTKERDEAKASLQAMTVDRDRLAGEDRDFNKRLASAMAKHGIRADGVALGSTTVGEKAKTLTEQCLEAKGK